MTDVFEDNAKTNSADGDSVACRYNSCNLFFKICKCPLRTLVLNQAIKSQIRKVDQEAFALKTKPSAFRLLLRLYLASV